MEREHTPLEIGQQVNERITSLRESRLRECARLAFEKTVVLKAERYPTIAEKLDITIDTILGLTNIARAAFENLPHESKPSTHLLTEDELLAKLFGGTTHSVEEVAHEEEDEITAQILAKEPFALIPKLDPSNEADYHFDMAATSFLENLDGVEVQPLKRYRRYSVTIGLNHPAYNMQLAITRRHITPEDDNPLEDYSHFGIPDPHGVHYSIAFDTIPKK